MIMIEHINSDKFKAEVLESKEPVLVDFFATWCGPCKMLGPVLERYSSKHPEVKVVKVDVDENNDLAIQYGVQGVPTLLLFKEGNVVNQAVGFRNEAQLEAMAN